MSPTKHIKTAKVEAFIGLSAKAPDLIVDDMFYTSTTSKTELEFPATTYDLHVVVKNVGGATTTGKIVVKAWQIDENSSPINFKPILPYAIVFSKLNPGQTQEVVWKNVESTASYYLAVVNLPTLPHFPLGEVKEGPVPSAVKNNARGIPGPKSFKS